MFVLTNHWEDRHCEGNFEVEALTNTFGTAMERMIDSVIDYISEKDGFKADDSIDYDVIYDIDGQRQTIKDRAGLIAYLASQTRFTIDVDNSGTWCTWDISEKEVED